MSRPPVFGHGEGRWSLGSEVRVFWWAGKPTGYPVLSFEELHADGVVAAITAGGPEGWTVQVSLGPLLDLRPPPGWPGAFNPSQVRRRGSPEESAGGTPC